MRYAEGVGDSFGRVATSIVLVAGLGPACARSDAFACTQDSDCSGGVCAGAFCGFPDDSCASGLRYGDHAGSVSGLCVLPDGVGGTSAESTTQDSGSAGELGTGSVSGPVEDPTTGLLTDSSGGGTGPIANFLFVDDDNVDFSGGTMDAVVYEAGRLRLAAAGQPGMFTSRIFDAGVDAQWVELRWQPDAPYGKPLLDQQALERGYAVGAVDMAGNVLLHHFDQPSPLSPGTAVIDHSGRGNDGEIVGDGSSSTVPGIFGLAMDDDADAYDSVPVSSGDFDFGFDGYTWSIWFRFSHDCSSNNVFMGIEDVVGGGDLEEHMWMGCTDSVWTECDSSEAGVRAGGVMISQQGAMMEEGTYFCGRTGINDGAWHHMAVVREHNDSGATRLYVDGELDHEVVGAFAQPIVFDQGPDFAIGAFTGQTFATSGTFDEAAVWTRPLESAEVAALYARGAATVELEVRVCTDADCASDPVFRGGSDLIAGESFTDPPNAVGPGAPLSVAALPPARWIQYRVRMDARADAQRPALSSVTIVGQAL